MYLIESLQVTDKMILDDATGERVELPCRSIRVGSYKSMPKERAVFTEKGIHLKVPDICSDDKMITLNFRLGEILRVDAYLDRYMPVLLMNLTLEACARARHALGMRDPTIGLWLGSDSKDETRKRITIMPRKLSDDGKLILKRLFDSNLYEMDRKAVNTMLVASRAPSATARAAFIRSQQQHLSVTAAAASRKGKCTALGDELDAAIAASAVERVKELERENERLREERTCKVCLDAAAAVLFDPCGHLSTCSR